MNGQTAAEGLFFSAPCPPGADTVGDSGEERRILIRSRDGERREETERERERDVEWVERGSQNQKMEGLQNQSSSKANFLYKMHFFQRLVWGTPQSLIFKN